jgi:hypothetical protein
MAQFNKFNCFVGNVAAGVHNMLTGSPQSFGIYLSNVQPVASNTLYGAPADLLTGNGYTAGGQALSFTGVQTAGLFRFGGSSPAWVASGGSIGPFEFAVLYNMTAPGQPLIGWWDYGAPITLTNGNTFTVETDPVNGILTLQ